MFLGEGITTVAREAKESCNNSFYVKIKFLRLNITISINKWKYPYHNIGRKSRCFEKTQLDLEVNQKLDMKSQTFGKNTRNHEKLPVMFEISRTKRIQTE